MGAITLIFWIVDLSTVGGQVKMTLSEQREAPPEPPPTDLVEEGAQLQKVEQIPKGIEDKIVAAMRRQFPEFGEMFKSIAIPSIPSTDTMSAIAFTPTNIAFILSREQYRELGSPSLFSMFKVSLELVEVEPD